MSQVYNCPNLNCLHHRACSPVPCSSRVLQYATAFLGHTPQTQDSSTTAVRVGRCLWIHTSTSRLFHPSHDSTIPSLGHTPQIQNSYTGHWLAIVDRQLDTHLALRPLALDSPQPLRPQSLADHPTHLKVGCQPLGTCRTAWFSPGTIATSSHRSNTHPCPLC